ncbi:MAG: YcaQ family DNA glycosylase [Yoonia sp.]|nr:YcaQ family DNA glycosylase [Yoonia sp.]
MSIPVVSNAAARRVFLHRHGLSGPPSGAGKGADLAGLISDLGFVQLDSVNTFARAHDLILWSRRQQYRPSGLHNALAGDRDVFEHWTHDAAAIDINLYPYWRLKFARDAKLLASRWRDTRRGDLMTKIDEVLCQVSDHGCCTSGDVGLGEERGKGGWWDWHPSKTALEYLWRSGQLSVVRRDGFKKVYDLTERVIPPEQLNAYQSEADTVHWACAAALDKLGFATTGELAAFWDIATPTEAKAWGIAAIADGTAVRVDIEGADGSLRQSLARPDLMDEVPPVPQARVRILSPFDPTLRDRKRAERLFGFNYRIEIFVPALRRQYGYYVFPVMEGDRLIGRIDMKADRPAGTLNVTGFWPEAGVQMGAGRRARLDAELGRAARFGGCADVVYADGWCKI